MNTIESLRIPLNTNESLRIPLNTIESLGIPLNTIESLRIPLYTNESLQIQILILEVSERTCHKSSPLDFHNSDENESAPTTLAARV